MSYIASEISAWGGQPVELYRFTRGLRVWTLTTADSEIIFNGETYVPTTMRRGNLPMNEERNNASLDIYIEQTADVVAEFISGASPTPTGVLVMRRHRNEASATEQAIIFMGQVGVIEFSEGEAHLTCVHIQQSIQRRVPRILYQTQCNWMLYDVNCTANKAAFTFAGHISAISGLDVTVPEAASKPDGYYNGGFFLDGDTYIFIMTHIGQVLSVLALSPLVQVGDVVATTAGCDRTAATCAAKFANLDNFMGFPWIPDQNPYEGAIA